METAGTPAFPLPMAGEAPRGVPSGILPAVCRTPIRGRRVGLSPLPGIKAGEPGLPVVGTSDGPHGKAAVAERQEVNRGTRVRIVPRVPLHHSKSQGSASFSPRKNRAGRAVLHILIAHAAVQEEDAVILGVDR